MTNKEREIILKELYMRIPYGIKVLDETWNYEWDQELNLLEHVTGIDEKFIYVKVISDQTGEEYRDDKHCIDLFSIKPFLRPMSSMTEKEAADMINTMFPNFRILGLEIDRIENDCIRFAKIDTENNFGHIALFFNKIYSLEQLDWLNAHHFDYRGLIEKGLAVEALEGMYKI